MEKSMRTLFSKTLDIFLLTILWIPYLLVLTVCCMFLIYRLLVHIVAAIIRPDLIPINNAIDNGMVAWPSKAHAMTNCCQVWFLREKLSVDEFRKHFYTTFLATDELQKKYRNLYCHFVRWGLYCFKKKSELNLNERIHEESLLVSSEKDTERFVENFLNTNGFGETPNWEIVLLHIRNTSSCDSISKKKEKTIVLFKIDHGLCDGYSFIHLIERLSGVKSPYLVKDECIPHWKKMKMFLTLPRLAFDLTRKLLSTSALQWENDSPKDPRMFMSLTTLDLNTVKKIRKLTNCHFNTILGVVQADALRKLFLKTGRIDSFSELPGHMYLCSATPWPGHPAMNDKGMANHLSGMMFKVSLSEEDCAQRLLKGEEDYVKMSHCGMSEAYFLFFLPLLWPIPHCLLTPFKQIIYQLGILSNQTYYFSPLMLSQESYQLLGVPVDHIYLPLHLQSVFPCLRLITIPVSNGGRIDVSVSGRMDAFRTHDEVDYFAKVLLKESLEEMLHILEGNKE